MKKETISKVTEKDKKVKLYPDGKYRWVYELNLLKNPTVLFDVWIVLAMSVFIVAIFIMGILFVTGDFEISMLWGSIINGIIVLSVITALCIIGYLVYTLMVGGKYVVLFIMDEHEIVHKQMPKTVKTAQLIGKLTMLAGAVAGKPGMIGTGLLAKTNTSLNSDYKSVKKVSAVRWMNLIKVEERFFKNRIYVNKEDFDFVFDYLCKHCPNATIKN